MNYEKLTVERFAMRLQENAYKGLTGARRAIGKTDWSEKDKKRAHTLADEAFAGSAAVSPKRVVVKKTAAPKAAALKVVVKKRAAAKLAVVAAAPTKPQAGSPRAAYARGRARLVPVPVPVPSPSVMVGAVVPPGPPVFEEVMRQNSASTVISAYRSSGPLNALEQRAYDMATAEYAENATKVALRIVSLAQRGFPTPTPLEQVGKGDSGQVVPVAPATSAAPVGALVRVLSPEEERQYALLERGAAAVPAILGHGNNAGSSV